MKSTCTVEEVSVHLIIVGVTQVETKKVGAPKISDCRIAMMMKSK